MNPLVFIAVFSALFAVTYAQEAPKMCYSQADCTDSSCVSFMPFMGTCQVRSQEGSLCLVNEKTFGISDIYVLTSPCDEGLVCQPAAIGKNKNKGSCVTPVTDAGSEAPPPDASSASSEEAK